MVPSTTDTIADNPQPPSPPPIKPSWKEIIFLSSCSLHWTSHRVSEGRCSLSTPLARLQTVWQSGEGGEKSRFVKAAPQQTAGNAIGGKLTIWFADKVLFWVLHLAHSFPPKLHQQIKKFYNFSFVFSNPENLDQQTKWQQHPIPAPNKTNV